VFDMTKLAWMNRHYMKDAPPLRLAREALPYFARAGYVTHGTNESLGYVESLLPMAVGSVDRLSEIPDRVAFVFEWDAARAADLVRAEAGGARAAAAFGRQIAGSGALDREAFRSAAQRARESTGLKGRALFHPIRVALTAAESGPELDLAVPAIDRGASLGPTAGLASIPSCADRMSAVLRHLQDQGAI
jgi:glutamyl/glutaminyl-tRNA synthetase